MWRRYLHKCDRLHVILAQEIRQKWLAPELAAFGNMQFAEAAGAHLRQPRIDRSAGERRWTTIAFLLRLDEAWPDGPGMIAAFGMDGVITLGWAYRLAHDCGSYFDRQGLTIVRIDYDALPGRQRGLDCFGDWRIERLVHVPPRDDQRFKFSESVTLRRRRRSV